MAAPLEPTPRREPVLSRDTLLLTATWVRWLDHLRTTQLEQQAQIADLQARVAALETPP